MLRQSDACWKKKLSVVSTSSELFESCTDTISEDNMATPQRLTITVLPSYIPFRIIDNFQSLALCFLPSNLNEKTWILQHFDHLRTTWRTILRHKWCGDRWIYMSFTIGGTRKWWSTYIYNLDGISHMQHAEYVKYSWLATTYSDLYPRIIG